MRKRVRIAQAVLLVAVGGVIVWQMSRPQEREPLYQGKGLSVWLRQAIKENRSGTRSGEAADAVRQIGTNAIPTFLRMLRKKDSPVANHEAAEGFLFLGADVSPQAVPALVEVYERNISPSSQEAAMRALCYLGPGPAARPMLLTFLRAVSSSNSQVRVYAVQALAGIHAEPSVVVPALAKLLSDDGWVRTYAARGLGDFGTNAQQAVPALARLLSEADDEVRATAANALVRINPEAAAKAGVVSVLTNCLGSRNWATRFRVQACKSFEDLGTNAQRAVPALVLMLSDPDGQVRDAATNALKKIDPEAAARAGVK